MFYNRSFTYVLPMLDWWSSDFLINSQLRGCFIGDVIHPELNNHILLLYRYTGDKWFRGYEEELRDCDDFVTMYEPDKNHTMFVYDVPKHRQADYDVFKQSKYSRLTDAFKKHIVEFHGVEKTKKIVAVMYKHESMFKEWENKINEGLPYREWTKIPREGECTDELHMDIEIFNSEMLKSIEVKTTKGTKWERGQD